MSGAPQPLRVGLDVLFLGPRAGGIGRYATELIPALFAVEPEIHVTAFAGRTLPDDVLERDWARRVEWVRFPFRPDQPAHLAAQLAGIPWAAARRRLHVLHGLAGSVALAGPRLRRVVTLHDLIWLHQGEAWDSSRRARRSAEAVQLRAARRAHRVITDSEASREDLVRLAGLDRGRIDVAPLGVRPPGDRVATPDAEVRRRLGIGRGPLVLCVAQKRPYKNLASLIRAVAALPDAGAQLALVGAATPHEAELRALARDLGVADRVHFPGWVSDEDLEGLYASAAAFVLPSLIEGFGLPVLEAMGRGAPVACSDRPALPEVAGDAALLFDPADQDAVTAAVGRLLGDDALRARLAAAGPARAAQFTWERTARATLDSYRRALAAP